MKAQHTLRELIHAINVLGIDWDVYVDGNGTIAICSPFTLTEEGEERYRDVLDGVLCDGDSIGVADETEEQCDKAWKMLVSAAGYCPVDDFNRYFEGGAEV